MVYQGEVGNDTVEKEVQAVVQRVWILRKCFIDLGGEIGSCSTSGNRLVGERGVMFNETIDQGVTDAPHRLDVRVESGARCGTANRIGLRWGEFGHGGARGVYGGCRQPRAGGRLRRAAVGSDCEWLSGW